MKMDANKMIGMVVGVMVGVLILSAALFPVIDSATTTEHKIINVGAYNLSDNDENYAIIYDPDGKFIIGDNEIPFNTLPADAITLASAKDMLLRFQNWAAQSYNLWLFVDGANPAVIASSLNDSPLTITFNDGTLTWGTNSASYTSDDSVRIFDPAGKYTMTKYDESATILKDTTVIVGNGTTIVNAWTNRFYIEGTAEDITVTPATGITVSDVMVNTTAISTYKDAVKLTSITFTATDGEHTVDATYNRVIVPREITAELAVHPSQDEIDLLNTIPILITVGLILGIVGAVFVRRLE